MSSAPTAERPLPRRAPAASSVPAGDGGTRSRPWLMILVAIAVIAALVAAVARGYFRDGPLEPDAPTPQGSKAVVEVLGDLDVEVRTQRHTDDAAEDLRAGRTVLLTAPNDLSAQQLLTLDQALEDGSGRIVLVQPDFVTVSYLTASIAPAGAVREETVVAADADCDDTAFGARQLQVPGTDGLRGASTLYRTTGSAVGCFGDAEDSLVAADDRVLVLGSADLLTNEGVREADNSALVLNALGDSGELTWYVPSANDPMASTGQTLLSYLPDWAAPLLLWLLLVTTITLLALGRRFGPVVVEPLPVTVRPQELVLGRARLLQQAQAREAAASALRAAAAGRLAERLRLRRASTLDELIGAMAPHLDRPPEQARDLLAPSPVHSDHDLVRLAHDLDRLEKEIDR